MYEVISERLWIGHALDIRTPRQLYDVDIKAVIDLAYEEPVAALPRDFVYCRFPLNDGEGNAEEVLTQAIQTTVDFLRSEIPTIVACSAGMSRSPSVAAVALAIHSQRSPTEVLQEISGRKSLEVSPAFWGSLENVVKRVR